MAQHCYDSAAHAYRHPTDYLTVDIVGGDGDRIELTLHTESRTLLSDTDPCVTDLAEAIDLTGRARAALTHPPVARPQERPVFCDPAAGEEFDGMPFSSAAVRFPSSWRVCSGRAPAMRLAVRFG